MSACACAQGKQIFLFPVRWAVIENWAETSTKMVHKSPKEKNKELRSKMFVYFSEIWKKETTDKNGRTWPKLFPILVEIIGNKCSIFLIFLKNEITSFSNCVIGVINSRLRFYREIYQYQFIGGSRCGYILSLQYVWAWSVY